MLQLSGNYIKRMERSNGLLNSKTQGANANIAFGFKAFRKEHPIIVISILLVMLMFLAGFAMRAFERYLL